MSRATSPDLDKLSSLEKIIEFINGFDNIKTIKKPIFPKCFKACWMFSYSPMVMHEAPNNMIIKMLEDANKISETNMPLLYYFMNGMIIEFTLQTLKDKIESNSLDGAEIPAVKARDEMIDKILNL